MTTRVVECTAVSTTNLVSPSDGDRFIFNGLTVVCKQFAELGVNRICCFHLIPLALEKLVGILGTTRSLC